MGQNERLLVFRFGVHGCNVVFVGVAEDLAENRHRRRHVWWVYSGLELAGLMWAEGISQQLRTENVSDTKLMSLTGGPPTFTAILKDTSLMVLRGG